MSSQASGALPGTTGTTGTDTASRGYSDSEGEHLERLARIEGQVRGISRMIDEDTWCIDVLTQVAAATKAPQAVALGLLDEHRAHWMVNAVQAGGDERDAELAEVSAATARLVRS